MDRVEFGIKLEQINKLRDKGDYEAAAKVVETIEWRKVKKWSELAIAEDVYERAGRVSGRSCEKSSFGTCRAGGK